MQMRDRLPTMTATVENRAIAALRDAGRARDLARCDDEMAEQDFVGGGHRVERGDVFFGHDQEVCRRLRRDVVKRDAVGVVVCELGGNFPRRDFTKEAVAHAA